MKPKPSACLIVLRPHPDGVQLLMVIRHNSMAYGGNHVFPGGLSEAADFDPRWYADLGLQEEIQPATAYSEELNLTAMRITALRETLEETGLHFGSRIPIPNSSAEFLEAHLDQLKTPPTTKLKYFMRMITPERFKKRYDTAVFLYSDDSNESVKLSESECKGYEWGTPKYFLTQFIERRIQLITPQLYALLTLAQYKDISQIMSAEFDTNPLLVEISPDMKTGYLPGDYRHKHTSEAAKAAKMVYSVQFWPPKVLRDPRLQEKPSAPKL